MGTIHMLFNSNSILLDKRMHTLLKSLQMNSTLTYQSKIRGHSNDSPLARSPFPLIPRVQHCANLVWTYHIQPGFRSYRQDFAHPQLDCHELPLSVLFASASSELPVIQIVILTTIAVVRKQTCKSPAFSAERHLMRAELSTEI